MGQWNLQPTTCRIHAVGCRFACLPETFVRPVVSRLLNSAARNPHNSSTYSLQAEGSEGMRLSGYLPAMSSSWLTSTSICLRHPASLRLFSHQNVWLC